jgi:4,5-dihydroxyphthalate decarboxylase
MSLKLTFGHSPNPRLQPLIDGAVTLDGVEFDWTFEYPGALFHRQLVENCFDVFEFSISDYLIVTAKPEWQHLGWQALPVFMSKPLGLLLRFYANESSGIRSFADFKGKRLAVPDYGMTAAVWLRIMLRALYGIQAQDITWYNGRPADQRHGRLLDIDRNPTSGLTLINLEKHGEVNEMLQRGELDVAMADSVSVPVEETASVRVFSTPAVVQAFMADMYRAHKVTPVNHTLVVKRSYLEEDPTLAKRLFAACEASKQEAYRRAREGSQGYLLFPELAFEAQAALFDEDPYPFGVKANRAVLEHIVEQQRIDGFVSQPRDIDSLWLDPSAS